MHEPFRPASFRLVTGGTRAADVVRLRALLAERLALRGLAAAAGGSSSGAQDPGQVPAGAGEPPVLVPVGPHEDREAADADMRRRLRQVPEGTDLVLRTSGSSTGTGRLVAVGLASLVASAQATHARLGGPGRWVLALPAHHVAGLQVLLRSVVAGCEPVVVDTSEGFSVPALAAGLRQALEGCGSEAGADSRPGSNLASTPLVTAVSAAAGGGDSTRPARVVPVTPVYVSLVPTQLVRVLQDEGATRLLAGVGAVLLGGAASSLALLARARAAGVPVVTTYGASETAGGCVYDGLPLDGVEVALDAEGRVLLSGPVLASGYVGAAAGAGAGAGGGGVAGAGGGAQDLCRDGGSPRWQAGARLATQVRPGFHRWPAASGTGSVRVLATSDRGRLEGGRLEVLGRMDGLITTGGVKVDPRQVEEVLTRLDGVAEACVVGVPDQEWGAVVAAAVVAQPGAVLDADGLRRAAREVLDAAHAPRRVEVAEVLPLRGPGKVDRLAVSRRLAGPTSGRVTAADAPEGCC